MFCTFLMVEMIGNGIVMFATKVNKLVLRMKNSIFRKEYKPVMLIYS